MSDGWIGVDLDGTLAEYNDASGGFSIGRPVSAMIKRVKNWLAAGVDVRIMTARVSSKVPRNILLRQRALIDEFCEANFGRKLPMTAEKDYSMIELWDDRVFKVEKNTGRLLA